MVGRTNIKGTAGYDAEYARKIHKENLETAGASGKGIFTKEMNAQLGADVKAALEPTATAIGNSINEAWGSTSNSPGSAEFVAQLNRTSKVFAVKAGQLKADLQEYLKHIGLDKSSDLEKVQKAKNDFTQKYPATYGVPETSLKLASAVKDVKSTVGSKITEKVNTQNIDVLKDQVFANKDGLLSVQGDLSQKVTSAFKKASGNLSLDSNSISSFVSEGTATISNLLGDIQNPDSKIGGMMGEAFDMGKQLMESAPNLVPKGIKDVNIENAVYKTTVGNNVISVTEIKSVIAPSGKTLGSVMKNSGKIFEI